MIRDGIKVARIQSRNSELNSSWSGGPGQSVNVVAAVKRVAVRLNTQLGGQRHTGRHVAPGRTFLSRQVSH